MKVSEVINELEKMKLTWGDLSVSISVTYPKGSEIEVMNAEQLFFGYDQYEDHDEINIRSFPY